MTQFRRRFHNYLRIIMSIDLHELVDAGVIPKDEDPADKWQSFTGDPISFILRLDDDLYDRFWRLMERRELGVSK